MLVFLFVIADLSKYKVYKATPEVNLVMFLVAGSKSL